MEADSRDVCPVCGAVFSSNTAILCSMSRRTALETIPRLAEDQWGLVTTAQLRLAGVARWDLDRLVADGLLERVPGAHGVYRMVGASADPLLLPLAAAWLQLRPELPGWERARRPDAWVSHRSAAELLELGDLLADVHEFTVVSRRQIRRRDIRVHVRKEPPDSGEWRMVRGLPALSAARTVEDLLADHEDGSAVATVAQDALRTGQLTAKDVAVIARRHAARYGMPSGDDFAAFLTGTSAAAGS